MNVSGDSSERRRFGSQKQLKVLPVKHPDDEIVTAEEKSCCWSYWQRPKLETIIPCIKWMRNYKLEYWKSDLLAGITVGTMLIPQGMSYARLASLPPIYGLYAGFMPAFIYAIFGSSRQLAVGPVALTSLFVSEALNKIVNDNDAQEKDTDKYYIQLAVLLTLMVGSLECIMGLLRLGWILRFVSHAVISGFTTASALIISLSQAKYFLGYNVSRSSKLVPLVKSIIAGISEFKISPFIFGSCTLCLLLVMKHLGKSTKKLRFMRAAGPLTAVVLGTVVVKLFPIPHVTVVGPIPQGLPSFSVDFHFEHAKELVSVAFVITGVAILESVGIAKALAAKNNYELDSNQELFGLGVANIVGSFFHSYPTTGSFSRSAVNHETGAKTGLAGIITGLTLGGALLFLTPLFQGVPQSTLAAIVMSAVIGLIDSDEAIFLWRVDKRDFLLWLAAAINTLYFGIETGVLIAVGLSLAFVIYESANPHIAILGRLPGTTVYRNVKQYPDAYTYHGIVAIRIDAPIYFANISYIKDKLREFELHKIASSKGAQISDVRFVIIEMTPVTYIDSSALHAIKELHQEYKARNIQIAFSNPNDNVMKLFAKAGIPELIGKDWYFVRIHDAVQVCLRHIPAVVSKEGNMDAKSNKSDMFRSSSYAAFAKSAPEELPLLIDHSLDV